MDLPIIAAEAFRPRLEGSRVSVGERPVFPSRNGNASGSNLRSLRQSMPQILQKTAGADNHFFQSLCYSCMLVFWKAARPIDLHVNNINV